MFPQLQWTENNPDKVLIKLLIMKLKYFIFEAHEVFKEKIFSNF